ncbi:MAG TPA: hypothetical protein VFF06_17240 [Polyangia bacterium]|nr:hypothetical protein [Polyangia bacterium]
MKRRAAAWGLAAVLAGAAASVALWFARPVRALRYAGAASLPSSGAAASPVTARAEVSLELDGAPPPERLELDLGRAGKLIVNRLP